MTPRCTECGAPLVGMYANALTCCDACRSRRMRRLKGKKLRRRSEEFR